MSEFPSHSVRYQDLPPRARSYVDNLVAQRDEIFKRAGFPEGTTFGTITKEQTRQIDRRDYQRLKYIGKEILRVGKTKEAPKEWQNWETQYQEALEILGPDSAFGPAQVEHTFGTKLEYKDIPPIPFTREELERAKELGQFLILRVDKAADGKPLTMKMMEEILTPKFAKDKKVKVRQDKNTWHLAEDFYTKETPTLRWALVSKEIIPNSGENYLQQTETIIGYLKKDVFKDQDIPQMFKDVIAQFESQKQSIAGIIKSDRQEAAELLENLDITKLTRQTPVEVLYDLMVAFDNTGIRYLRDNYYTWTSRRTSRGRLVDLGDFDPTGAVVDACVPGVLAMSIGVVIAR
jgi:hypothetical protein